MSNREFALQESLDEQNDSINDESTNVEPLTTTSRRQDGYQDYNAFGPSPPPHYPTFDSRLILQSTPINNTNSTSHFLTPQQQTSSGVVDNNVNMWVPNNSSYAVNNNNNNNNNNNHNDEYLTQECCDLYNRYAIDDKSCKDFAIKILNELNICCGDQINPSPIQHDMTPPDDTFDTIRQLRALREKQDTLICQKLKQLYQISQVIPLQENFLFNDNAGSNTSNTTWSSPCDVNHPAFARSVYHEYCNYDQHCRTLADHIWLFFFRENQQPSAVTDVQINETINIIRGLRNLRELQIGMLLELFRILSLTTKSMLEEQ